MSLERLLGRTDNSFHGIIKIISINCPVELVGCRTYFMGEICEPLDGNLISKFATSFIK